jgi:hypothetical protein
MQLQQHVPPILSVPNKPRRLSVGGRLLAAGVAVCCLAVLITACTITPAGEGFGTHTQLGLAPCGMLASTGIPCMTCGYTTSFSHFVRGNLLSSLFVQPGATVLATLTAAAVWIGGYVAATGRPAHRLLRRLPFGWTVATLSAVFLGAWAWKIFLTLSEFDGW